MQSQKENRVNQAIETAIKNLDGLVDVNTVFAKPIITDDGEYIIPYSKVTLGVLVGGGEYGKVTLFKSGKDLPYSAGNGAVISVKPTGFLIKDKNNTFKMISADNTTYEKIIDKAAEIFNDIQNGKIN